MTAHRSTSAARHRAGFWLAAAAAALLAAALPAGKAASPSADPVPANVQYAVDRGLEWLAKRQAATGAFTSRGEDAQSTAITSLAVMAFLARGHTPGQGPYGEAINKAVDWVLQQQQPNGALSFRSGNHTMYDHGISTVMLCEVYAMVADQSRRKKLDQALPKAVRLILDAQRIPKDERNRGGWRYNPTAADSDISVSGWQLMALRGAANVGAAVPKSALDDGVAYIRRRAVPNGGFSYQHDTGANQARTGTGILSLELLGQHHSKEALAGGDYLLRNPIKDRGTEFFYYAVYYCSQAGYQLGDKYYAGIYTPIRDTLVASQQQSGAWPIANSIEQQGGEVYSTSMAILALAVPYRYLPLYQR